MRYRMDAARLRTLLVVVLCCAAGVSSQIHGQDLPAANSIKLLRPRGRTLNKVTSDEQVQLSAAPAAKLVPAAHVKLPDGAATRSAQVPTRPRVPSKISLPPVGAKPPQLTRVSYIPLPIDFDEFTANVGGSDRSINPRTSNPRTNNRSTSCSRTSCSRTSCSRTSCSRTSCSRTSCSRTNCSSSTRYGTRGGGSDRTEG